MTPIIYLACPYTHSDREVRQERFEAANEAAAHLIQQGFVVFSPISMTHPIDIVMATEDETMGSDYWVRFDEAFMALCSEMVILAIPGWDRSRGIRREIDFFFEQGKPVKLMHDLESKYGSLEPLKHEQPAVHT